MTRAKHGRTVTVRLAPDPLRAAIAWLARYERFWVPALDRLTAHAEARRKAETLLAEKMKGLTGGLPLPPGLKLF